MSWSPSHRVTRVEQVRGDAGDVRVQRVPGLVAGDHQAGDVLVEHVADDLDRQIRLGVELARRGRGGELGLDLVPLRLELLDVAGELLLGRSLGGRTDDHARLVGEDLLQDRLEAVALVLRELAADPGHRPPGA